MANVLNRTPAGAGLSPEKLQFLMQMLGQMRQGNSAGDLLSSLQTASQTADAKNLSFSDAEADLILQMAAPNSTPEQKKKIEMIRNLSRIISMKNQLKK